MADDPTTDQELVDHVAIAEREPPVEDTSKPEKVTYEPEANVNRVTVAVQGVEELVEIDGPFETSDPVLIATLDGTPGIRRASGARAAGKSK
jgi:hypothetical protein